MGHIWREQPVDVGIDGTVELVEAATGSATGRVLFVQSKAPAGKLTGGVSKQAAQRKYASKIST